VRNILLDERPVFGYQTDNRLLLSADFSVRHDPEMDSNFRIATLLTVSALLLVSVVVVVRKGIGAS